MTLDRAIEILTIHNDHNPNFTDAEREVAHQLAIEALKGIKKVRKTLEPYVTALLPGESREQLEGMVNNKVVLPNSVKSVIIPIYEGNKDKIK